MPLKSEDLLCSKYVPHIRINRVFKLYLHALNSEIEKVHRVKDLKSTDNIPLLGALDEKIIYIADDKSDEEMTRAIIHELAHWVFKDEKDERRIIRIENLLWKKFSFDQKLALLKYIPKKITLESVVLEIN